MILFESIKVIFESIVKSAISVVIESSLNLCKELAKFIIILVIAYYFAERLFQFWDEALGISASQAITHEANVQRNESVINNVPSLVDQLEIEAEFEENKKKLIKSNEDFKEFLKKEEQAEIEHKNLLKLKDSDEGVFTKKEFVSLTKEEPHETSRASQTIKTSLGKKSKLRESQENDDNNESRNSENAREVKELLMNLDAKKVGETERTPPSFDDQYDNESSHRA